MFHRRSTTKPPQTSPMDLSINVFFRKDLRKCIILGNSLIVINVMMWKTKIWNTFSGAVSLQNWLHWSPSSISPTPPVFSTIGRIRWFQKSQWRLASNTIKVVFALFYEVLHSQRLEVNRMKTQSCGRRWSYLWWPQLQIKDFTHRETPRQKRSVIGNG